MNRGALVRLLDKQDFHLHALNYRGAPLASANPQWLELVDCVERVIEDAINEFGGNNEP